MPIDKNAVDRHPIRKANTTHRVLVDLIRSGYQPSLTNSAAALGKSDFRSIAAAALAEERARLGRLGGAAVSKEDQRIWVACLIQRQVDAGRVPKQARRDVAKAINNLLSSNKIPAGFQAAWFEVILARDAQLKTSYSRMTAAKVRELSARPTEGLPPTDIPIPTT